jgi:hypothetical protein
MDKVSFVEAADADGVITEHAIIDRGNGEFTSMTKAHYEELEAAKVVQPPAKK